MDSDEELKRVKEEHLADFLSDLMEEKLATLPVANQGEKREHVISLLKGQKA